MFVVCDVSQSSLSTGILLFPFVLSLIGLLFLCHSVLYQSSLSADPLLVLCVPCPCLIDFLIGRKSFLVVGNSWFFVIRVACFSLRAGCLSVCSFIILHGWGSLQFFIASTSCFRWPPEQKLSVWKIIFELSQVPKVSSQNFDHLIDVYQCHPYISSGQYPCCLFCPVILSNLHNFRPFPFNRRKNITHTHRHAPSECTSPQCYCIW